MKLSEPGAAHILERYRTNWLQRQDLTFISTEDKAFGLYKGGKKQEHLSSGASSFLD